MGKQVLPLRVRVNLGVMAMIEYSTTRASPYDGLERERNAHFSRNIEMKEFRKVLFKRDKNETN